MNTRLLTIMLDRQHMQVRPQIKNCEEYPAIEADSKKWNWNKEFSVESSDFQVVWVKPVLKKQSKPMIGVVGFQWKPEDKILDAVGYVLPHIDRTSEELVLTKMGVDKAVQRVLKPRPQILMVTTTTGLYRHSTKATDGNNRMTVKNQLLGYVSDKIALVGFMALERYWNIAFSE